MSILKNVRAYLPGQGIVRTDIEYENGIITNLMPAKAEESSSLAEDAVVLPGFIDQHIHGAGGFDTMDATEEALIGMSGTLVREGTTAFLATTMTQSPEKITNALHAVRNAKDVCTGASLLGVHLEGPFISPKFIGAQPPEYVVSPSVTQFEQYQSAADGLIRMVSLAPEEAGADAFISHLSSVGVATSAGHSAAGYSDMERALECGLRCVTHTYNAQSPVHHREIGVAGSAMLLDPLYTELICDTIHVSAPAIRLMLKNKPHDRVILITDSMRAKGLPDGVSELGGQTVYVKDGQARLASGVLAGSVLRMNDAIRNLVEKVGVSLTDAVDYATANPARHLGIYDRMGSIEVGKAANFAVLDGNFNVLQTIVNGQTVYQK